MDVNTPVRPKLPSIPEQMTQEEIKDWMINISDALTELAGQIYRDIIKIVELEGL